MDTELTLESGWQSVIDRLAGRIDFESRATTQAALVRRRAVGSAGDLLRLCFGYVLGRLSLRMLSAWAEDRGIASLSDVALLKRLRGSADWLEDIARTLIAQLHPELTAVSLKGTAPHRLCLVDGSMIGAVGTGPKARRLHVVYDLIHQRIDHVDVTNTHTAERLDYGVILPGDIRIGDRGYARHGDLASVLGLGGDFIVRTGSNRLRMVEENALEKHVDLETLCALVGIQNRPCEHKVMICKGKKGTNKPAPLAARLIIVPLPEDKVAAAVKRSRRQASRWQYKPSAKTLAVAGYMLLLTSLPADTWPAERVLAAYRLRWQIELLFKRWKSIIGMSAHRAKDPRLIRCWIATALIVALMIEHHQPDIQRDEPDSLPFAV
jgi:hypothetical protein